MKRSEEKDNVAMNSWLKRRLLPVISDDCQVALRHLKLYTKRKSIGNPANFAHSTMQWCNFAGLAIARSLINNSSASLEIRTSAMAQLVSYTLAYPRTIVDLDREALKRLLQEDATTNHARLEMARLARTVALSETLWQATKEYIESAVQKIGHDLKIADTFSFETSLMAVEATDKCMRVLLVLSSKPPVKE